MKKWLVGFMCVFLANTAWGQSPAAPPAAAPAIPIYLQPEQTKTICVAEPSTRIKVTIKYSSKSEKVCLPSCPFPFFGSCQQCEGGNCGTPATKRYLVKKIVTEEEKIIKCVPRTVPINDVGCQLGIPVSVPQPPSVAPPIETIPVPPVPSKK